MRITPSLLRIALTSCMALSTAGAWAQAQTSPTKDVNLSVNFNPRCQLATGSTGPLAINFGVFDAFVTTDVSPAATTVTFECSRGQSATPVLRWDGPAADRSAGGGAGGADAIVNGTIAGLRYQLAAKPGTNTPGLAPVLTPGNETAGTATTYTVDIQGTLFQGPGAGTAGAQTDTRVLTVVF